MIGRINFCGGLLISIVLLTPNLQAQESSLPVAIVDFGKVLANYAKAGKFKEEMERMRKTFDKEGKELESALEKLSGKLDDPATNKQLKDKLEAAVKKQQDQLDAFRTRSRDEIGKRQAAQIAELYKDISDAVASYAKQKGILIVLGYGEQLEGDLFNFPNLNRKMQGMDLGATSPLYVHPRAEITQALIEALNRTHAKGKRDADL